MKKYENSSKVRSYVTNFQPLLAFNMGYIPAKLHQFLISSFQDFVRTDRHTDAAKSNTCSQHSWRAGNQFDTQYAKAKTNKNGRVAAGLKVLSLLWLCCCTMLQINFLRHTIAIRWRDTSCVFPVT